ncbi:hypothetical protein [Pseudomaricurvus alcaniphilus]|uniref:capsular polysaccharide export protein, LipB/KpsS family n=1 Tax=Pseudomaricurvus alcaniphilus TaxID=1166482 RepID=UPI001A9D9AAE
MNAGPQPGREAVKMIGYFSSGIGRLPHLQQLLEAPCRRVRWLGRQRDLTHIMGWGRKPTAARARRFARDRGLPYISIEDGFLRSVGLGVEGAAPHSLAVDYSGIYYDATGPSDLESLIINGDFDEAELARAARGIELMRTRRLSKYNNAADHYRDPRLQGRAAVLVVDQTFADPSVACGLADGASFANMLDSAIANHPEAQILVKVHPDVLAGKKQGYLAELAQRRDCLLLDADISPWAALDLVDEVYVVTSQMGFEALMAGKIVHCFGMPFYAGWGLTRDALNCPRRGLKRPLAQVFAAAYLRYCRYVDPLTGERCEFEQTAQRLVALREGGKRG